MQLSEPAKIWTPCSMWQGTCGPGPVPGCNIGDEEGKQSWLSLFLLAVLRVTTLLGFCFVKCNIQDQTSGFQNSTKEL